MGIANQFEEIGFLFTEKGLIAVLAQTAATFMAPVALPGISGKQSSHYCG
jgi:hypothetical protein